MDETGDLKKGTESVGVQRQYTSTAGRIVPSWEGLAGLDEHQVRRWHSWHRWTTLAMLAHGFLVVTAAAERARNPTPPGLIPLTCNEIQRLFAVLVAQPVGDIAHLLRWS